MMELHSKRNISKMRNLSFRNAIIIGTPKTLGQENVTLSEGAGRKKEIFVKLGFPTRSE